MKVPLLALALLVGLDVSPISAQSTLNGVQQPPPLTLGDVASVAPVQSVNGSVGAVVVPTYQHQASVPMPVSASDGTVTWTFPVAFSNAPTCFYSLFATSTTHTFDFPQVTAISKSAVSLMVSSHPKALSIPSIATLPILLALTPAGVPAGTTITFSCFAPL